MTTIKALLEQATQLLAQSENTQTRLDAQVLLGQVLGVERSTLYAYPERAVTAEQAAQYLALIERRRLHEPIAYLTGHKEFYGLDFLVDRRVLIPRPETEFLVEAALEAIRARLSRGMVPVVADIGTGSGAIPITLAVIEPRLPYLYAIDISRDALEVARLNSERHHVQQRVRFLSGDLLAPLPEPVDVLLANLPYVGTDEREHMPSDVHMYEPHLALFSGPAGLDLLERLCTEIQAHGAVRTGGTILLEIGYRQRVPLTRLFAAQWPGAEISSKKDYAGFDRILQVTF